ncbi:MAG TPA: hypothetical protein VFV38_22950 [Ktedonobacteraceae bacterium]|nr:hypothetical protein [Ktedonobacteraceae bacterium]
MEPQIEARAAYASLVDETQPDAILRAVYWNSQTVIPSSPPETTPMKIPARFVQVPNIQTQQWIRRFEGLQTSLQIFSLQNDSLSICSLRIEIDSVDSVFEKVWQVPPDEQDGLTRAWIEVWDNMGKALQTCPVIAGVEESFASLEEKPEAYDLQGYKPVLTLP